MGFWKRFFGGKDAYRMLDEGDVQGLDAQAKVNFKGTQRQDNGRYDVYTSSNKPLAMEFLREYDVKEPKIYITVETPEGNVGKDVISIFDEKSGKTIELGKRKPLTELSKSQMHCTKCGYFVFPIEPLTKGGHYVFSLEHMRGNGLGFKCPSCEALWCAFCVHLGEEKTLCELCGSKLAMKPYQQKSEDVRPEQ